MIDSQRLLDAALDEVRDLTNRLELATTDAADLREAAEGLLERAESAERQVQHLQREVDKWQGKYRELVDTT